MLTSHGESKDKPHHGDDDYKNYNNEPTKQWTYKFTVILKTNENN